MTVKQTLIHTLKSYSVLRYAVLVLSRRMQRAETATSSAGPTSDLKDLQKSPFSSPGHGCFLFRSAPEASPGEMFLG